MMHTGKNSLCFHFLQLLFGASNRTHCYIATLTKFIEEVQGQQTGTAWNCIHHSWTVGPSKFQHLPTAFGWPGSVDPHHCRVSSGLAAQCPKHNHDSRWRACGESHQVLFLVHFRCTFHNIWWHLVTFDRLRQITSASVPTDKNLTENTQKHMLGLFGLIVLSRLDSLQV